MQQKFASTASLFQFPIFQYFLTDDFIGSSTFDIEKLQKNTHLNVTIHLSGIGINFKFYK